MFVAAVLEDDIKIAPADLSLSPLDAVTAVIEQRFIDRVITQLGLVVTLREVQSIEGGFVYPNDGAAYFRVRFGVVCFRPFVGEVITAKLKSSNKDGLRLSLDFFDDVLIPAHALQEPSLFDTKEQLWLWTYEGSKMYMDLQEEVRFRVKAIKFNKPPTPIEIQNAADDDKLIGTPARPFAPMEVIGDINGDGLGCCNWWRAAPEAGDE